MSDVIRDDAPIACVTGASGMIGRRIVQRLLTRGYEVRVLTRGGYAHPGVQIFRAGLSDGPELEKFIAGAKMVFHCAAEIEDASKMREVNVLGTERIVRLIGKYHVGYFCHMSSAGVIGSTSRDWVDESTPCRPQNMYELTKMQAEQCAGRPIAGCTTVILRPTNVVDEDHLGELNLPASGSFKSRLKAFVKGGECAHIVHAEDVAEAAVFFAMRPSPTPRLFFVSLDDDPLNTVANLWSLYRAAATDQDGKVIGTLPHLPVAIPHMLRRLMRGTGNRGDVRYSSRRLASEGFKFAFGVREIVNKIVLNRGRSG